MAGESLIVRIIIRVALLRFVPELHGKPSVQTFTKQLTLCASWKPRGIRKKSKRDLNVQSVVSSILRPAKPTSNLIISDFVIDEQQATRPPANPSLSKAMKLFTSAIALACLTVPFVAADGATGGEGVKSWGYKENDPSMYGPSEWGAQYPTCAGKRQSPIDISAKTQCGNAAVARQAPLAFAGECTSYKLTQSVDAYKGESQNGTSIHWFL